MPISLDDLAAQVRAALLQDRGASGREAAARALADALRDREFVAACFAAPPGARTVLYRDPQLGFCVSAHEFVGARAEPVPHDHGPSWAIYGQVEGDTRMNDYEPLAPTAQTPPQVRKTRDYLMRPGDVHVYHPGDIHASTRTAGTRLLRIEGADLGALPRSRYVIAPG